MLNFVVGTGRCGSSLIHEILANHEQVGFISNIDDNLPSLRLHGRFNSPFYALTRGAWTQKGRLRLAPSEGYRLIRHEVSPIYENSSRDLLASDVTPWMRQRFRTFFDERCRVQGRACFLHKYTGWPRMGFFGEIFPDSRFIHIVRDGRAVANSWLQMGWWGGYRGPENWLWGPLSEAHQNAWEASGRSYVTLAGLSWRILMEAFLEARAKIDPERYMEIRYEDFLTDPVGSLRSMLEFVGLSWSHRIERAVAGDRIRPTRRHAHEADLTVAQVVELERTMGDLLARYKYV